MSIDLHLIQQYFKHLSNSTGANHLHAPFAFDFYTKVLRNKKKAGIFSAIEQRRKQLLKDNRILPVTDFGAGSKIKNENRKVSEVARYAAKQARYGRLLHRIAAHYHATNILELGTSLGISSAYLASANADSRVITMEGWPEILQLAKETFQKLDLDNITTVEGNFDDTLDNVLASMPAIDLAFIDGNHQETPTLNYFEKCLPKIHNNSILIFDDIYWTRGMEKAWKTIQAHPEVRLTIDTFYIGIVFFRKEIRSKQHFKFRY